VERRCAFRLHGSGDRALEDAALSTTRKPGVRISIGRRDCTDHSYGNGSGVDFCVIGGANEKPPVVQDVIHATPGKIKKAALAMLVADGYTIDSDTASQ